MNMIKKLKLLVSTAFVTCFVFASMVAMSRQQMILKRGIEGAIKHKQSIEKILDASKLSPDQKTAVLDALIDEQSGAVRANLEKIRDRSSVSFADIVRLLDAKQGKPELENKLQRIVKQDGKEYKTIPGNIKITGDMKDALDAKLQDAAFEGIKGLIERVERTGRKKEDAARLRGILGYKDEKDFKAVLKDPAKEQLSFAVKGGKYMVELTDEQLKELNDLAVAKDKTLRAAKAKTVEGMNKKIDAVKAELEGFLKVMEERYDEAAAEYKNNKAWFGLIGGNLPADVIENYTKSSKALSDEIDAIKIGKKKKKVVKVKYDRVTAAKFLDAEKNALEAAVKAAEAEAAKGKAAPSDAAQIAELKEEITKQLKAIDDAIGAAQKKVDAVKAPDATLKAAFEAEKKALQTAMAKVSAEKATVDLLKAELEKANKLDASKMDAAADAVAAGKSADVKIPDFNSSKPGEFVKAINAIPEAAINDGVLQEIVDQLKGATAVQNAELATKLGDLIDKAKTEDLIDSLSDLQKKFQPKI
jgi:hypothetical protein